MNSDHNDLWDALTRASRDMTTPIKESLAAVIAAAKMPEKFWDADLRQLHEMGAIPILRRMLTETPTKIQDNHEFLQAFARCPKIE